VQDNHLHLVVEARDGSALSRGVQGFAIRVARRVNTLLGLRGSFWADRFHSRELTSPRAVRNAIVYVLMNAKKPRPGSLAVSPTRSHGAKTHRRRARHERGLRAWVGDGTVSCASANGHACRRDV
jgi:hypothetical protein